MADVHQIPQVNEVERAASEWIARLNADDVSSDDRARFEAWRAAHPLHARVYEELSATWEQFRSAGPFVRAVSFAQSLNVTAMPRRPRWPWAFAATVVLGVFAVTAWHYSGWRGLNPTFRTATGEHATIVLQDGSKMELNSQSVARVEYSPHARIIHLDRGEGFFKVAHDPSRPFWVVGDRSWVRAVGTEFNVHIRPTGVLITVNEGVVKVGAVDSLFNSIPSDLKLDDMPASVLIAGEQAEIHRKATATRRLSATELARAVAWRDGILYFENQPLGDVVAELGRYTPLQLIVSSDALRQLPVGGTFQANPQGAEVLLGMLQQGFGLRVRREPGRAYIEADREVATPVMSDATAATSTTPF